MWWTKSVPSWKSVRLSLFVWLQKLINIIASRAHCTKNDFQECIVGGQLNILSPEGWNEAFKSHFCEFNGPEQGCRLFLEVRKSNFQKKNLFKILNVWINAFIIAFNEKNLRYGVSLTFILKFEFPTKFSPLNHQ